MFSSPVSAQAPAVVYKTQIYGHGKANAQLGAGDPNLGRNAMVVDASGNVYVAGTTFNGLNTDFLTVKYNAAGVIQWRAIANGAADSDDISYALGLDASGNIFVTGSSRTGSQSDFLTVKYDNNGVELWRAVADGAAHRDDDAYAMAIDAAGNAFVAGVTNSDTSNPDYLTVKYSPTGTELWRITMAGATNGIDRPIALCLDNNGSPAVTGYSLNGVQSFDYVTVKYVENSGIPLELWRRTVNGSANSFDLAFAMACDATGNTYVTGKSHNGNNFDYLTVKYNAGGNLLWQRVTDGLGNADSALAVVVDSSGNVYVTGQSDQNNSGILSVTNPMHLTVKYDVSGVEQWRTSLNGSGTGIDAFSALAVDTAGNAYVTGFADHAGSNELILVKYAPGSGPTATELWRAFIVGAGSADAATLMAIGVDGGGNVVVGGNRINGADSDFLIVKFGSGGNEMWRSNEGENVTLTSSFGSTASGKNALAIDLDGNAYAAGQVGTTNSGEFISAKIDAAGMLVWSSSSNIGSVGNLDRAYAIALDSGGNVYVGGDSVVSGFSDFLTIKYNAAGVEQWRRLAGHSPNTFNSLRALMVDANGNVVVTGFSSEASDFLTIKYDTNGNQQWRRSANGAGDGVDMPVAMAIDAYGNVLVTGRSFDGNFDGYLTIKYDGPTGVEQWRKVLAGSANAPQLPYAIAVDAQGSAVVAGDSIVKYDIGGNEQWQLQLGFRAYALALGSDGAIGVGGSGGLVARYGAGGAFQWSRAVNGTVDGADLVQALTIDGDGAVYTVSRNANDTSASYLTVKYRVDGVERWRASTGTGGGGANAIPALLLDANRNVVLAGNAVTASFPTAMMVTKLTQAPPSPTNVIATPGDSKALISFSASSSIDSAISGYVATCQPGAIAAAASASPIVIEGLTNDVLYSCSVKAQNAFGPSAASQSVTVTPTTNAPLALFGVKSRKRHGSAGDYDLDVGLSVASGGIATVEPRVINTGHELRFTFSRAVNVSGTATALDATMSMVGNIQTMHSGNQVILILSSVPDGSMLVIQLTGVNGVADVFSVPVGFLVGDVTNSGKVTAADIGALKARAGQILGASNYKYDLNLSGAIDLADVSTAKARAGVVAH